MYTHCQATTTKYAAIQWLLQGGGRKQQQRNGVFCVVHAEMLQAGEVGEVTGSVGE
jgi:hypothetical protein